MRILSSFGVCAKRCQNPAKAAKIQTGFAAFRGCFAGVSRHGVKTINSIVNKGVYLFHIEVLSVSRQGVAFSDWAGVNLSRK